MIIAYIHRTHLEIIFKSCLKVRLKVKKSGDTLNNL